MGTGSKDKRGACVKAAMVTLEDTPMESMRQAVYLRAGTECICCGHHYSSFGGWVRPFHGCVGVRVVIVFRADV